MELLELLYIQGTQTDGFSGRSWDRGSVGSEAVFLSQSHWWGPDRPHAMMGLAFRDQKGALKLVRALLSECVGLHLALQVQGW